MRGSVRRGLRRTHERAVIIGEDVADPLPVRHHPGETSGLLQPAQVDQAYRAIGADAER